MGTTKLTLAMNGVTGRMGYRQHLLRSILPLREEGLTLADGTRIDFALDAQRAGMNAFDAIRRACLLRFRPIMMTTAAAMLGALPLALGTGIGSELRRPLGIAIVGGLLLSQLVTLYTTPVIYLYMERFSEWLARRREQRALRDGSLQEPQA